MVRASSPIGPRAPSFWVLINAGGVNGGLEGLGGRRVVRHDALAVSGAVPGDVVQGFLQAIHGAYGHLIVHKLSAEAVRPGGTRQRINVFQHGKCPLVGINRYVLFRQRRAEGRKVPQARAVDDEAVQGVADAYTPGFRIEDDGLAHLQVT